MKSNQVDIIIVNLNGKCYLEKCLSSIVTLSRTVPYRLVIVDNGSTDGSLTWIRHKYPDAAIIQNKVNVGFAQACNQGILKSDGEYILLLNNDTEFLNDLLGILARFIQDKENIGLVGLLILHPNGDIQSSIKRFPSAWKFVLQQIGLASILYREERIYYPYGPFCESDYEKQHEVEWLSGSCLMFRRSLSESIGLLDENMPFGVEDMDYARRASRSGFRNFFVPEAKLMHYKGGSRQKNQPQELLDFVRRSYDKGILTYFGKHHSQIEHWLVGISMAAGKIPRMIFRKGMYRFPIE